MLSQEPGVWILIRSQVRRRGPRPKQSGDLELRTLHKASTLKRLHPWGKDRDDSFPTHTGTRKHVHLCLSFKWEKQKRPP